MRIRNRETRRQGHGEREVYIGEAWRDKDREIHGDIKTQQRASAVIFVTIKERSLKETGTKPELLTRLRECDCQVACNDQLVFAVNREQMHLVDGSDSRR